MAVKFLDNTGLGYFWSKIKAWCNATFAAITHNQASNTINAMTGYSKPNSGSAIATSDSLNSAIGKLEAKVDAVDDSNYVHLTNDETILDKKIFKGANLWLMYSNAIKGETRLTDTYNGIVILDSSATYSSTGHTKRFAMLQNHISPTDGIITSINTYKNDSNSNDNTYICVGYDGDNIAHARAPSTSSSRNEGTDIVTRDWIPLDTRILHTTSNETCSGIKRFSDRTMLSMSTTKGATRNTSYFSGIYVFDDTATFSDINNHPKRFGRLECCAADSNVVTMSIAAYKDDNSGTSGSITVGYDTANGYSYAYAPSTSTSRTGGGDIVTRDWIPKDTRIVHTTENETISGIKYFNNTIRTGMSLQYRNSTLTRGVAPSENKYYTLAFYDKDGYDISNRFGFLEVTVGSNGNVNVGIGAYRNIASTNSIASIGATYHADGTVHAYAPSTSAERTAGDDILTRDWIPKDTRIVHTTGNDTISGIKYFKDPINLRTNYNCIYRHIENYTVDQLPGTLNWVGGFVWRDKNSRFIAGIEPYIDTTHLDYYLSLTGCSTTGSFQTGVVVSIKHTGGEEVFRPRYNNQMTLGNSSFRWKQLYAVTATISTSDERLKSNIGIISEDVLDAWEDVDWVQFQFKDAVAEKGIEARLHTGLVAQHIMDIFSKHNLDRNRYAFFCYDSWDAIPEKLDKDGNVLDKAIPAGDVYSIRYEEALCVEAAYQRRKNKILENRISELEKQVSDMLILLQNLTNGNG